MLFSLTLLLLLATGAQASCEVGHYDWQGILTGNKTAAPPCNGFFWNECNVEERVSCFPQCGWGDDTDCPPVCDKARCRMGKGLFAWTAAVPSLLFGLANAAVSPNRSRSAFANFGLGFVVVMSCFFCFGVFYYTVWYSDLGNRTFYPFLLWLLSCSAPSIACLALLMPPKRPLNAQATGGGDKGGSLANTTRPSSSAAGAGESIVMGTAVP